MLRGLGLLLLLCGSNLAFFFDFEVYTTDIAVIGTGPGSATFGGRVAKARPHTLVTLFEKGGKVSQMSDPDAVLDSTRYLELTSNMDIELGYFTTPQANAYGMSYSISRAGVNGGCDSHNGLVYRPPVCEIYAKYNLPGFDCATLEYHRNLTSSTVEIIISPKVPSKTQNETIAALMALGVPFVSDAESAGWSKPGVQRTWHTMKYNNASFNERRTAFNAFIEDNSRLGKNLKVVSNARIEEIIFTPAPDKRAVLLLGTNTRNGKRIIVVIKEDLALGGGAYDTPALLQASGVGNAPDLTAQGIKVIHNVPNLGKFRYHVVLPLIWLVKPSHDEGGPLQRFDSMVAVYTKRENGTSGAIFDILHGFAAGDPVNGVPSQAITVVLSLKEYGPGKVTYNKLDPTHPTIDWNLYANPGELQHMIDIFKLARNYTQALPSYLMEAFPGNVIPTTTEAEFEYLAKVALADGSHPGCSAQMCNSPSCPVDSNFKLRGLKNVYIVDTSVLPEIAGANTKAITLIMGSLAADKYVATH